MSVLINRRNFLVAMGLTTTLCPAMAAVRPSSPLRLPIKVGQLGTGHAHASGKWQTINQFPELFDVVGIHEPNAAKRDKLAERPGPYRNANWISEQQALDLADLVVVETDVHDLVATAMRAVTAGKHLHLDKPGGTNVADFRELLDAAEQRSLVIQMGYMFRYNPAFEFLFQAVRDGWLGSIREVNGAIGKKAGPGLRSELSQYSGGGMFELGCHLIDATLTVMGTPENIHSFNRLTGDDKFIDNQLAVLEYAEATATIRCNHVDPFGGPRRQFSVIGDAGSIEIRPLEPPALTLMLDRTRGKYAEGKHELNFSLAGRYDRDFQDLAAVLSGSKEFQWDYEHDLAVQKAVIAASGASD